MANAITFYKDLGFKAELSLSQNDKRNFKELKACLKEHLNQETGENYITCLNAFNEGRDQFLTQNNRG